MPPGSVEVFQVFNTVVVVVTIVRRGDTIVVVVTIVRRGAPTTQLKQICAMGARVATVSSGLDSSDASESVR